VNKTEKAWIERVVALGCVVCRMPAEYHHILKGKGMGKKASHFDGIPLCDLHHRNGGHGVAIHSGVKTWEANFGTEHEHLERVRAMLL
jgi:hypothetical protein